jgi:hypothetical protein
MAFCVFVTPEGFEPPTNRTGICHSIQLNYGVVETGANVEKSPLNCSLTQRN